MLKIVMAMSGNGLVGLNNTLPWSPIKEDFKNFVSQTRHHDLIMGANTFKSLPSKLSGRRCVVVVTDNKRIDDIVAQNSDVPDQIVIVPLNEMDEFFEGLQKSDISYAYIGGIALIDYALRYADKIVITDVFMFDEMPHKKGGVYMPYTFYNKVSRMELVEENLINIEDHKNVFLIKEKTYENIKKVP